MSDQVTRLTDIYIVSEVGRSKAAQRRTTVDSSQATSADQNLRYVVPQLYVCTILIIL